MKSTVKALIAGFAMFSFVACDNAETEETSIDSLETSTIDNTSTSQSTGSAVTPGTYRNLYTGSDVNIEQDANTGYWVDVSTRTPVEYYIAPNTTDTFDMQGRNVSGALDRGADGKYVVNEQRLKVKYDSDGDFKVKSEDEKMKYDASSDELKMKSADGTKEKVGGNR